MKKQTLFRKIFGFLISVTLVLSINICMAKADNNTPPTAPTGLLTNELEYPLNTENATFFWLPQDEDYNEVQTAYEIVVTDGITNEEVWDSGKVLSSEQSNIKYNGDKLKSGYPYKWKVRTWDKDDESSPYSEEKEFATGIPDDEWNASWISAGASGKNIFRYMRKQTELDRGKTVAKVLAYVACCHDYELNVNGKRIGRGQSFDYIDHTDYQGWDITDTVKEDSDITIGIVARWYGGGQGRATGQAGLMAKINVLYTDGTVQTIVTDDTWKTSSTPFFNGNKPVVRNSEGDFVEQYDARLEKSGWNEKDYDDSSWNTVTVLGEHPIEDSFSNVDAELGHVTEIPIKPESVEKLSDGSTLVDFGRVLPLRLSVHFKNGTDGKIVNLQPGYELNEDGTVNTSKTSLQETDMRFAYTQKNGEQTYNTWDHLGFRYVQIPECGEDFTIDDIDGKIIRAEVAPDRETTFESSDEMLNNVYELMKNSALLSVQNEFVDTPTREKGQFLDDSRNMSAVTTTAWYERATSKKAIMQFLTSADRYWNSGEDLGRYNAVYPNVDGKRDIPEYSIDMPYWVWTYYMTTGDRELLEKAYPYMKATAEYINNAVSDTTGLVTALPGGTSSYEQGIVDWPAVGRFDYDWNGTKNGARTTINALSFRALNTIADMAKELDNNAEESLYRSNANALKQAMNDKLINSDGVYCDGLNSNGQQVTHAGQHSTSYPLAFGIAPEDKISSMLEYVSSMGMKQGPMTADILIESLFNTNNANAAYDMLTNTTNNGWAKLVDSGYTFTWESWSSNDSKSHGWGAASAKQITENVMGVKVTEAGAKKIQISPAQNILENFSGSVMTERGRVNVEYSGSLDTYNLKVKIPVNVEADICFPVIGKGGFYDKNGIQTESRIENDEQIITIGSGEYDFVFDGELYSKVKIANTENIDSYVQIDGKEYPLPMTEFVKVKDTDSFKIVSNDFNYEFSYFDGDMITANTKTAVSQKGETTLNAHFKYVSDTTEQAVLTVKGTGNIRVNGEIKALPYEEIFEKGTEITLEGAPTENQIFDGFSNGIVGAPAIIVMNGNVETTAQFRENGENKNVSKGIKATAMDSLENDAWGILKLTDGVTTGSGYTSNTKYTSGADVSSIKPWIKLDLGKNTTVDRLIFYPRTDAQANKDGHYMFPQDFYIEVSEDDKSYKTVATVTGAVDDNIPDTVDFNAVNARYVRVVFTRLCESTGTLGDRRLQLAELEVYSGATKLTPVTEIELDKTSAQATAGQTVELSAIANPDNASFKNINWLIENEDGTPSDKAYITVDIDGKASVHTLNEGTVRAVARSTDGFSAISECIINIVEYVPTISIAKVDGTNYSLELPHENGTLITAIYDTNGVLLRTECDEIKNKDTFTKNLTCLNNIDKCKVTFMYWNSINELNPIANSISDNHVNSK